MPSRLDAEQEKLLWADTVIFQFPLWWYTMPAILKGWVDRVFTHRFAYGVGEHSDTKYGERFGEGTLAGRKALLSVTVGGPEAHYAARGINGPIDDLLFPIHHGILYYPGIEALPPFVLYGADRVTAEAYSHEVIAFGFWPGDDATPFPAYYSYTAPAPDGLTATPLRPAGAWWAESGTAQLRYDDVRTSASPRATLLEFLASAYAAGAERAGWDVADLATGADLPG